MDATRIVYRELTDEEKKLIERFKLAGDAMMQMLNTSKSPSREEALAKTKIEEAVMWGVKHITR